MENRRRERKTISGERIKDAGLDALAAPDSSNEDEESLWSSRVLSVAGSSSGNDLLECSVVSWLRIKVLHWERDLICQNTRTCLLVENVLRSGETI